MNQLKLFFESVKIHFLYFTQMIVVCADAQVYLRKIAGKQIMVFMITLEVIAFLIQFTSTFILQNTFFSVLSFIPVVAIIGGFEYSYQKKRSEANEITRRFRKKFYSDEMVKTGPFSGKRNYPD